MENKINIAEILKDCPKGMKLYSPLLGEVTFEELEPAFSFPIKVIYNQKNRAAFTKTGLYYVREGAECLLFPSSEMRDWSRFFKPGDVAIDSFYGRGVLVEEWADESYTSFKASVFQLKKGGFAKRDKRVFSINIFDKASDEQRHEFIANMEKFFGGKYNPETLQVEPVKPERPFKPFDKVLVRCGNGTWRATFFSHCDNKSTWTYVGVDCNNWEQCIPYNEHTAHLLGTADPYTEGGSE